MQEQLIKSKSAQHACKEDHNTCLEEAKVLQIELNVTYTKLKDSALSTGPNWVHFYLRLEVDCNLQNTGLNKKNSAMDNVHKINKCINIPSSETFKSYTRKCFSIEKY
jgi:hypothetical protein